jgi:RNA polymerase sigma factor (sigma-70 family)
LLKEHSHKNEQIMDAPPILAAIVLERSRHLLPGRNAMPTSSMAPLMRQLRRTAFQSDAAALSDGQLLERFLARREEAAFEALVRRHGPMVLGVCRRILRNGHDAEDAFQATFLVLVRKAGSIAPRELVGNWLYGVAYRTALKARSMTARRRLVEAQVRDMSSSDALDAGARVDLQTRLDQELNRLPDKYRAPVILCELEGKSRRDAALQLGIAEGTLSSRLARARQMLARRLSGPNGVLSASAVSVAMATQIASAVVPAPLLAATVKAGALFALGEAATVVTSAKVAALTHGVLKAMFLTKLKTAMTVIVMVSMLALTVGAFGPGLLANPSPAIAADDDPPQKKSKPEKDKTKKDSKERKIVSQEKRAKVEEVLSQSFTTKSTPKLVVETFNGPITVTTVEKGAVNAKVVKTVQAATEEAAKEDLKNIDVQMKQDGDTVRIAAKSEGVHLQTNRGAAVELQVPAGSKLDLHTSNGAIKSTGPTGDATLRTSNGKIEIKGGKGKLNLKTSNGPINAEGSTGSLELKTSNGAITVKSEKASVNAHTSNGAIHFSGSLADGKHEFHSSNGSIGLTLPANSSFAVDAHTSHGKATTEFKINVSGSGKKTSLKGSVGDSPATTIHLHTSNGNIDIKPEK